MDTLARDTAPLVDTLPPRYVCKSSGCDWQGPEPQLIENRHRIPHRMQIHCPKCGTWIKNVEPSDRLRADAPVIISERQLQNG